MVIPAQGRDDNRKPNCIWRCPLSGGHDNSGGREPSLVIFKTCKNAPDIRPGHFDGYLSALNMGAHQSLLDGDTSSLCSSIHHHTHNITAFAHVLERELRSTCRNAFHTAFYNVTHHVEHLDTC